MRFDVTRDIQHLIGDRHFEIHPRFDGITQNTHVAVGNVAAIFPQVHRDPIRARLFGDKSRLDRIRVMGATRVADGSNVVDVNA